ncbi:MAG: N-6 DNA methylase [Planctomycetota bacterium]|nr:N-6 DNA methylase [Planctomycetota bacterium]MDI6787388.1 N-6 DNA methylase [Planctomycetota bacterium]
MINSSKTNSHKKKYERVLYNNNVDAITSSKVHEPSLYLFQEKVKIDNNSLSRLYKDLHNLLKLFIGNAKSSSNTKIFLKTNDINNDDKFIVESAILYFGKVILMKYCKDNDFLKINFKCDLYESLSEFYDFFRKIYYDLESNDIYSQYIPPRYLNNELIDVLDRYDFTGIDIDIIGKLYENFISKEERILLGQVYTPDEVVKYILTKTGWITDASIERKKLIDIGCGTGVFLLIAVRILINNLKLKGTDPHLIFETVQKNIWGMDINPFSLRLAELNLLISTFELLDDIKKISPNYIPQKFNLYLTNSINKNDNNDNIITRELKTRSGMFASGFDYVVGNPPYLEAKKMPTEVKSMCRKSFPDIANGAFDLYYCFIKLALELLSEKGSFGFIIPNKFLVLKSAKSLRKNILDNYKIDEVTDISNLPVFKNISVYPILLFIKNVKENNSKVKTYDNVEHLQNIDKIPPSLIAQNDFKKTEDFIFFILPSDRTGLDIYKKLSSINTHLKDYCDIRWTISFHKKGIIDEFIFHEPTGKNPKPILGANIYSRDAEVKQYRIKWSGLWIDYDVEKAKQIDNPLPPIEIFETPKLIIRQNAEQLSVAIDNSGKWILKDVYFSGLLSQKAKNENISLEYIAAILNSNLMNYYYSILFKGGHVNGGYLHFLVGYLNALPIKIMNETNDEIKKMITEINGNNFKEIKFELDKLVCKIFDLNNNESKLILNYE